MDFQSDINHNFEKIFGETESNVELSKYGLYQEWLHLKKAEDSAYEKRLLIESKILKCLNVGHTPIDKSSSQTVKDQIFSVNIKRNIAHKCEDFQQLEIVFEDHPDLKPYTIKPSISASKLEKLAMTHPELFKQASRYIEVKENKATISISIIEN